MEDIRIDSHKLIYHPERVAAWARGDVVYPIYLEISPSGACNHRCAFCAKDFVGYRPVYLDAGRLESFLAEMAAAGLKSAMFAGEGEPCLHRDIVRMARGARHAGLDISMTTNGSRLVASGVRDIIGEFTWLRVSMNAGRPETYARVHGCREDGFAVVVDNIRALVEEKRRAGAETTIGVQCLLLPENENEIEEHARLARDLGVDYFSVKPFTSHPKSGNNGYSGWVCEQAESLAARLAALQTPSFSVLFRASAMTKIAGRQREYGCCLALPFWAYLNSAGDLYGCSTYLGDERFNFGNMMESSFHEIWHGPRRRELMEHLAEAIDLDHCRYGCRMDEVNRYLWQLSHPGRHVNFI